MQIPLKKNGQRYALLLVLLLVMIMTAWLGCSLFRSSPAVPTSGAPPAPLPVRSYELPILAYHSICRNRADANCVEERQFRRHLQHLQREGFRTISFEDLLRWQMGVAILPNKPIILTFDDGYADNYTVLAPILREERMRATVFLTSRWIGTPNFLTWEQVREMERDGFEIGGHTQTHTNLTQAAAARQLEEIAGGKREIEAQIQRPVLAFAYPYGFYDEAVVERVKQSGFRYAVSGESGWAAPVESPYALKRIVISGYTTFSHFQKQLRRTEQQLP